MYTLEKVRHKIGETNSSSCHSFSYTTNNNYDEDTIKNMFIRHVEENDNKVKLFDNKDMEFGWDDEDYDNPMEIFNYLLIGTKEEFVEWLSDYLDMSLEIADPISEDFFYIDHESVSLSYDMLEELKNGNILGVFDGTLTTGNDNDNYPFYC